MKRLLLLLIAGLVVLAVASAVGRKAGKVVAGCDCPCHQEHSVDETSSSSAAGAGDSPYSPEETPSPSASA